MSCESLCSIENNYVCNFGGGGIALMISSSSSEIYMLLQIKLIILKER